MLFYVNIYGSFKLSKNSPVFLAHPVQSYRIFSYRRSIKIFNWVKKDVKVCTGKDLAGQLCKLDSENKEQYQAIYSDNNNNEKTECCLPQKAKKHISCLQRTA